MAYLPGKRIIHAWDSLSLKIKGVIAVSIPLVSLLTGLVWFYGIGQAEQKQQEWVENTIKVRSGLHQLLNHLVDVETGMRGYLLTRRDEFPGPYRSGLQALPDSISRVPDSIQDNPRQVASWGRVQLLLTKRFNQFTRVMEIPVGAADRASPLTTTALLEGKAIMDAVRGELNRMHQEEARLMVERAAELDRGRNSRIARFAGAGLLGILGGLAAIWFFSKEIVCRMQALGENAHRLLEEMPLLAAPVRNDEIGRLEQGVIAAGQLLAARVSDLRTETRHLSTEVEARQLAGQLLGESEQRYRTLFNSIDEGFCVIEMLPDPDGCPVDFRYLEINPAFGKQTGLHGAAGKRIRELVPDIEAYWIEVYGNVAVSGEPIRVIHESKSLDRWFEIYAFRLDGPESRAVAVLFSDITARKRCEEANSKSQELLALAVAAGHLGIWDWDLVSDQTVWDQRCKEMAGLPSDREMSYSAALDTMHPDDRARINTEVTHALETKQDSQVEYRTVWPDGTVRWVQSRGRAIKDAGGRLVRCTGITMDVTERREAEEGLRQSEARFRSIFHEASVAMMVTLPDGQYAQVNRAFCGMLGYSEQEVLATTGEALTHPEDRARTCVEPLLKLVRGAVAPFRGEKRYLHKDGHVVWADVSTSVVCGEEQQPLYLISQSQNISGRKYAEKMVVRINRELESLVVERTSELTAVVAALELEIAGRHRLEREIFEVSEREQCRLGQDLHDGLGQELAGIALLSSLLANRLGTEVHPEARAASDIATYIRHAIESARRLAKGLYPIELSRGGLIPALGDLAGQTSQRFGLGCEMRESGESFSFGDEAAIHLYRIVQECIGNAIKHGGARHILIEFLAGEGACTFTVTNDGLDFEKRRGVTGMGLHLMNYRARVIGAEIEVAKPPQGGCRVTCRLPA